MKLKDPVGAFWRKVDKNGPVPAHRPELGKCWVWTAGTRGGYGRVRFRTRLTGAHRASWIMAHGDIGEYPEVQVLHHCDNTLCVNPSHLFIGDSTTNMRDMVAKGRNDNPGGEQHRMAKLSEVEVRAIRESAETGRYWAAKLGVTEANISRIRLGKTWRHLLEES